MAITTSIKPLILVCLYMFLSLTVSEFSPSNINLWCSKLPYPETCDYYMDRMPHYSAIKQKSKFAVMVVQIALDQALQAQNHTMTRHGKKFQNDRVDAAFRDCHELFENAILRLNHTIHRYTQSTHMDRQTWLSTALTNFDTCRTGFHELGVSEHVPRLMSDNATKLLSNALAFNKYESTKIGYRNGFPTWVSDSDLVLLRAACLSSNASYHDLMVAQDGSGDYKTINEALSVMFERKNSTRFVIYVKAGTYAENVDIDKKLNNIMLVGDGMGKTIVTGNQHIGGSTSTFRSATFAVSGDGFIARDMTFQNTAGPQNGQAVALRSGSDLSVFYKCSFEGYQDTLYVYSDRQFYRECDIYGTVDFIFGNAAVVLQNCNIYAGKPENKINTITAQGRSVIYQNTGIVIQNSKVLASEELKPVISSIKTFLGRPWRKFSRTVFMETFFDELVDPEGWLEWGNDNSSTSSLYYGEYNNTGPRALTSGRVKWSGFHVITNGSEASEFTVGRFLVGDSWLNSTGVPYTSGL